MIYYQCQLNSLLCYIQLLFYIFKKQIGQMQLRQKKPINSYTVDNDDNSSELDKNDSRLQGQSNSQVQRILDKRNINRDQITKLAQILVNFIKNINEDYQKLKTQKKELIATTNSCNPYSETFPQRSLKQVRGEFKQQQQKLQTNYSKPTAPQISRFSKAQTSEKKMLINMKNKEITSIKNLSGKSISKNNYDQQSGINLQKKSNNEIEKLSGTQSIKKPQKFRENALSLSNATIIPNQPLTFNANTIKNTANILPGAGQMNYSQSISLTQLQQMMNNIQANFGPQNNCNYLNLLQNMSMMNYLLQNSLQKNISQIFSPQKIQLRPTGILNPIIPQSRGAFADQRPEQKAFTAVSSKSKSQQTLHKRSCYHITIAYSTHLAKLKQFRSDLNSYKIQELDPTYPAKHLKQQQKKLANNVLINKNQNQPI